ncbi:heat shock protein 30C-like [Bombina bombina]|uniref:heat shock protein 30C-like n=1 Tax=Bombina bombina TaxID=8345 RepID=UPI00235A7074|nr:heat shock protein 30C-like [Bombina bombina]
MMFPLSLLQSSHSPLCTCSESALTLWPATRLIYGQLEDEVLSLRNDMDRRMQRVNQTYQLLSQDIEMRRRMEQSRQSAAREAQTISTRRDKDGNKSFALTLDVSNFSPDELTAKTEGRRLIVIGKHDKKSDSRDGSFFHEYKEWKRETELPEDVNPEDVLCSLSKDGQLHIQAPRLALTAAKETAIPITLCQAPEDAQQTPAVTQNSGSEEGQENIQNVNSVM